MTPEEAVKVLRAGALADDDETQRHHVDGRLAAMIGERLGSTDTREMSAICTHPDFLGLGYARRLTAMLTNRTLAAGRLPFLHVSYENARAKALYERMGYRLRADVGFWSLRRESARGPKPESEA